MKPKLIFLDIDGTLTPPGSNAVPESALSAIRAAQKNGHKVFLCSGRNLAIMSPVLRYGFDGAVAGAGGYVFIGDQVLFDCPMEKRDLETGLRLLHETGVFCMIEAKEGSWCDPGMGEFQAKVNGGNSELIRLRRAMEDELGIRPLSEYTGVPVYKIVFMCSELSQLYPAQKELGDRYSFVVQDVRSAGCLNGEMISSTFNKGSGVRLIAETLGADLADTIGFGDSMNDLEMIETVGYSVCMENGSPRIKALSDMVCPAEDRDGIAAAFKELGLC